MILKIKNLFLKNFFNLSSHQLINVFFTLLITPLLFRRIGTEAFGLVSLCFSIVSLISVFNSYGFNLNSPKDIATNKNNRSFLETLICEILTIKLIFGFLLVILFSIIFYVSELFKANNSIIIFSLIIIFSEAINPFFYFQGKDQFFNLVISNFLFKSIYFICLLCLIKSDQDAYLVNFLFGLTAIFIYAFYWINIFKNEEISFTFINIKNLVVRIKDNFEFMLSSIWGYISVNSGIIILTGFVSNVELGNFAVAQKVGFFLRMFPVMVTQSILQKSAILYKKSEEDLVSYLNNIYKYSITVSFFLFLIISFLSEIIIYILTKQQIEYSQNILILLSVIPLLSVLNLKNMIFILVEDKKRILNLSTWLSTIFMLISALILSYKFGGYGLCYSLILTEIINFMSCKILLKLKK